MRRRAWAALGVVALLGAAFWMLRSPAPAAVAPIPVGGRPGSHGSLPEGAAPAAPSARATAPAPGAPARAPGQSAGEPVPLDAYADPSRLSPADLAARRQHRVEATHRARDAWRQHPPHSRPISESEDLLVPEQIAPTVRPLADPRTSSGTPKAVVRQTQDRLWLRPGTAATVGLEAAAGGEPVPLRVTSAVLVRWSGEPPSASAPIAEPVFAPAGPGLSASFLPPAEALRGYAGEVLLRAEAEVGAERGTLVWAFVYTGDPPARFTGAVRDRLEAGSVLFGVDLEVLRPGRYRVQGRVDDVAGKPLALARWDGDLAAGSVEVPLLLFGKIARDEGGTAPFALRDVEGFRLLDGVHPDRETMEGWRGPHRSRAYRGEELSPDPWDGSPGPAPRHPAPGP